MMPGRTNAFISLGTFLLFGILTHLVASLWGFDNPMDYPLIMGLPRWVFLLLVVGSIVQLAVQIIYALTLFKDEGAGS